MVETAGYLPLPLTAEGYLELLPARWQAVNSYCIKIKHRIYNCEGLDGLRRGKSGITEREGLWEVRHDPYDIRLVWLRNNRDGGKWITVPWRLLSTAPTPFGELAWDHESRNLREQGEQVAEGAMRRGRRSHGGFLGDVYVIERVLPAPETTKGTPPSGFRSDTES